jgi:hypothetical protein
VLCGVVALAVCGAVAQASSDPGEGAPGIGAPKAAAAPTSEPTGDDAQPPDDLGDDSDLDALAEACFEGDLVACDHLYLRSPIASAYESYGDTCAGRQAEGTGLYCGLATAASGGEPIAPEGLGDDPALDALAQSCYAGDMAACDELYGSAELGSAYQAYGDTCAGRQPPNTGNYCTALQNPVPGTGVNATTAGVPTSPVETSAEVVASTVPADTVAGPETTSPGEPGEIPAPTMEPTGLGGDPALDALAQSCYDGELSACDDLYQGSEPDTAYRAYGDTCAGRQAEDTGIWCVDAFGADTASTAPSTAPATSEAPPTTSVIVETTVPADTVAGPETTAPGEPREIPAPTVEPTGLGDDPALDALAQSCYDGELSACDDLYQGSEPGTAYRAYGDTCAGRQAEDTGIWCVDAFGADTASTAPSTEPASTDAPTSTAPVTSAPTTFPDTTTTISTLPPTTTSTTAPMPTPPPTTIPVPVPPTTAPPFVPTTLPSDTSTTIAGVIPPPTLEPIGLGDDPTLDALAQSCYDGDMEACDNLWSDSVDGSAYRNFGDTCAGRQPPNSGVWCVDAFAGAPPSTGTIIVAPTLPGSSLPPTPPVGIPPATQQPSGLGDDAALDALAQACFAGDMLACDDLFDRSPIGSAYMMYGDTCAGRQEPHTFNYCRVTFPG